MASQMQTAMTLVWNGVTIESRECDKYVNATQMARAFGKKFSHWYDTEFAKNTIAELERDLNHDADPSASSYIRVLDVRKGRSQRFSQGSWIHPDLCAIFAQWLSPKFAIAVGRWIRTLLTTGKVELETKEVGNELSLQVASLQQQLEAERKERERLNIRVANLTIYTNNFKELEKDQIFYLATTQAFALQNFYKFGGVKSEKDLIPRLKTYNSGTIAEDPFFYVKLVKCNDYKTIEHRIHNVLGRFKNKQNSQKEMLYLRYDLLERAIDFICDNYDKEVDFLNEHCKEFLNNTLDCDEAKVPPAIELGNSMEVTVRRNGAVTKRQVVDITTWSDEKINEIFNEIIDKCAQEKLPEYQYQRDKNRIPLLLEWKMLYAQLKPYSATMNAWKELFRKWYKNEVPRQLKLKGITM